MLFDAAGTTKLTGLQCVEGDASSLDVAKDVRAVAGILYTLATGHTPSRTGEPDLGSVPPSLAAVIGDTLGGAIATPEALVEAIGRALPDLPPVDDDIPSLGSLRVAIPEEPPGIDETEELLDYISRYGGPHTYDQPFHRKLSPIIHSSRVTRPGDALSGLTDVDADDTPTSKAVPAVPYQLPQRQKPSQMDEIQRRLRADEARMRGELYDDDGKDEDAPSWVSDAPSVSEDQDYMITPATVSGRVATPAPMARRLTAPPATPRGAAYGHRSTPGTPAARAVTVPSDDEVFDDDGTNFQVDTEDTTISRLLIAVGVAALALPILVGSGVYLGSLSVTKAMVLAQKKQSSFLAVIETEQDVVAELSRLGGNRGRLERAFFAYKDSSGNERAMHAVSFAHEVELEWQGMPDDAATARTKERVLAITTSSHEYERTLQSWRNASSSLLGGLAITLGLAERPS